METRLTPRHNPRLPPMLAKNEMYSRVPNSSPDPNNRPGRTNFLKINKRPGVLLSKNDPNKSILDRKLSKINKNVLPHYSELKSTYVHTYHLLRISKLHRVIGFVFL